ncbi:glycosyltransferase family 39 protein [Oscillatoria salina]|uniref:glycosyltransferase family 39 protein n=1 Tax=Oscillatoria salina TaxID=331517 RepID=UPI001CCE20F1|nr:glycosyltransferase family 39 protein [Oscillatoria salina]MBZ8182242.1 hypothetical protein [Oscillatoria salina IIICB1]
MKPKLKFRWLILFVLLLGIFFRFLNLDGKLYWHDEVHTSLRINGYNSQEVIVEVFTGEVTTIDNLLKFQLPSSEKTLSDTISALLTHPEHPPLYYLLAHFWVQLFGGSVAVTRSLSAIISLLAFPCLYWLCRELFNSQLIAWIAIILFAVSPVHVLYAQEAREYSLWTVTILLTSATLLRAKRKKSLAAWLVYSLSLTTGFYTSLLSAFVALAHGIYLIIIERWHWTKNLVYYFLSSILSLVLFTPWLIVIFNNYSKMQTQTNWAKVREPFWVLWSSWELSLSSVFIDIHPEVNFWLIPRFALFLLLAVGYSVYFPSRRRQTQNQWLFILTLICANSLAIILPDLLFGERLSTGTRYFIPAYMGIQIAVAYLLADAKFLSRKIWTVIVSLLLAAGIISCGISSQADTWWNKISSYHNAEIAQIINQSSRPLLVSDAFDINLGNIISLTHLLENKVRLQLMVKPKFKSISSNFENVFVFNPSPTLKAAIEKQDNLHLELVYNSGYPLWKAIKL